jgi:hypothetical protein
MPGKPTSATTSFRVALNPKNPEANSWYDPDTGINLFLNTPESADLAGIENTALAAVVRGIRAGLLIISRGELPEGLNIGEVNAFAAPRSRWSDEHQESIAAALRNHAKALSQAG